MTDMKLRDFETADTDAVAALWQACDLTRSWNDPVKDIARKQTDKTGAFWVGEVDERVIATVMIGYDGHRGSINYLAIDPKYTGQSLGRFIMDKAEAFLIGLNCPKVAMCVRRENDGVLAFYDKLGYGIDDVYSLGKRLIPDE